MNELYHYGIPGQRHGRRRFQNPDGSLTPAGRARYLSGHRSSGSSNLVTNSGSRIKRPSDSNKPSDTSYTKQSTSGLQKRESSRAEYNRINSAIQAVAGMSAKHFNAYMTYGERQEGPIKENDIYRRYIDRVYDMASRMGLDDLPNVQNDSWDRYFRNMGTKSVN